MATRKTYASKKTYLSKRLLARLGQMASSPLTVVTAPAGSGKTAAATAFLENSGLPFCLIDPTKDRASNRRALGLFCPGFPDMMEGIADDPMGAAGYLCAASPAGRRFLVVDQYQLVPETEDRFFQALARLASSDGLGLVLMGRERIIWASEALITGQAIQISLPDLSLMPEDLPQFLRQQGLALTLEQIEMLYGITAGWMPALLGCLAEYRLHGRVQLPAEFPLWLRQATLDTLPEELRAVLMALTPFDSFTFEQAAFMALPPDDEAGLALGQLFQRCLLLQVTGSEAAPHPLFWQAARQMFDCLPVQRQQTILSRAGEWCLARQQTTSAVRFFCRSGRPEALLGLLRKGALARLPFAACQQAEKLLAALPEVTEDPALCWQHQLLTAVLTPGESPLMANIRAAGLTEWLVGLAERAPERLAAAVDIIQLHIAPWFLAFFCHSGLPAKTQLSRLQQAADQLPDAGGLGALLKLLQAETSFLQGQLGQAGQTAEQAALEAICRRQWGILLGARALQACIGTLRRSKNPQQPLLGARNRLQSEGADCLLPVAALCLKLYQNGESPGGKPSELFPLQRLSCCICWEPGSKRAQPGIQLSHKLDSAPLQTVLLCRQALTLYRAGRQAEAEQRLLEAFTAGERDGFWLPFTMGMLPVLLQKILPPEKAAPAAKLAAELHPGARQTERLTQREWELAQLAARGFSNREIGERLFLSENTVKSRLKVIFNKLDIRSRRELRQIFEMD